MGSVGNLSGYKDIVELPRTKLAGQTTIALSVRKREGVLNRWKMLDIFLAMAKNKKKTVNGSRR